jgi:hypothetical protein
MLNLNNDKVANVWQQRANKSSSPSSQQQHPVKASAVAAAAGNLSANPSNNRHMAPPTQKPQAWTNSVNTAGMNLNVKSKLYFVIYMIFPDLASM